MLYRQLPVILFLIFYNSAEGQRFWVKGYGGLRAGPQLDLFYNVDPDAIFIVSRNAGTFLWMPALVFENPKENFLEIGFSWRSHRVASNEFVILPPSATSVQLVDLGAIKRFGVAVDCGFNYKVHQSTDDRWNLFFGWTVNPFWDEFEFTPRHDYLYAQKNYETGINWGFIPRLQFNWLPNLRVDMNACLFAFSTYFEHTQREQFDTGNFALDFFKRTWVRAGLSWSFITQKKKQD